MPAYTGRDVLIEFAIAKEDATYAGLTWSTLGMMRDKGMDVSWDTVDATADDSPQFTKENLVTFKMVEFSGSGVSRTEALHNQKALKAHVYNPPVGTDYQPKVWIRQTAPDGVTYGPFIVNKWSDANPYSDVGTWDITAMSNGAITFVAA
jgi:predicted secreted protein